MITATLYFLLSGDKFDLKEFHHQVLKQGYLPLDVLKEIIDEWLDAESPTVPSPDKDEEGSALSPLITKPTNTPTKTTTTTGTKLRVGTRTKTFRKTPAKATKETQTNTPARPTELDEAKSTNNEKQLVSNKQNATEVMRDHNNIDDIQQTAFGGASKSCISYHVYLCACLLCLMLRPLSESFYIP